MTRLNSGDLRGIPGQLEVYDDALRRMTGTDLAGLACRAYAVDEKRFGEAARRTTVGVIPVTWGLGVIEGFSETVARIVAHVGFRAFVTRASDVAGMCEAAERCAQIILLSDDACFAAINQKAGRTVDNSAATGRVFATGLDLMAGGIGGKRVLVIGCGPVGRWAASTLLDLGADLTVVDLDSLKARNFSLEAGRTHRDRIRVAEDLDAALYRHDYILDASPAGGFISEKHVAGGTLIAAPGVPLGLDDGALAAAAGRLLHDPLQLGVAAMAVGSAALSYKEGLAGSQD